MAETPRIAIRLDPALVDRADLCAALRGMDRTAYFRLAIEMLVRRDETAARAAPVIPNSGASAQRPAGVVPETIAEVSEPARSRQSARSTREERTSSGTSRRERAGPSAFRPNPKPSGKPKKEKR